MKNKIFSILYFMSYSDHYEPLDYYQSWHSSHRKQHLDKMIKHRYENRTKQQLFFYAFRPSLASQNGATPLFVAAETGSTEVVERLIAALADVETKFQARQLVSESERNG